jgi:predicted metalloendopeptidase
MEPRWKRVIDIENRVMGEAIGHVYGKYFDPDLVRMEMVSTLKVYRKEFKT